MNAEHICFADAIDEAVGELRQRLLLDVHAAAENTPARGGIRSEWRQLVLRLAKLRNAEMRRACVWPASANRRQGSVVQTYAPRSWPGQSS
jgi:hypothetical protein